MTPKQTRPIGLKEVARWICGYHRQLHGFDPLTDEEWEQLLEIEPDHPSFERAADLIRTLDVAREAKRWKTVPTPPTPEMVDALACNEDPEIGLRVAVAAAPPCVEDPAEAPQERRGMEEADD